MPERWIRPSCLVTLALAWALDLVTPQLFVVAILFNVPIALSSLALRIGLGTVKGHIRDILEKLAARDRTQAAVMALRRGLI